MKQQMRGHWCGPASVQNALRAIGSKVAQSRVAKLAGTTEDGTNEHGIVAALNELGYPEGLIRTDHAREAIAELHANLAAGDPVVLCVDQLEHWVTAVGLLGDRTVIVDPQRTEGNLLEHLTTVYGPEGLIRRWRAKLPAQQHHGLPCAFYGVALKHSWTRTYESNR